jgi:glycosyltransferase involved in cell wall biosynthesis
LNPRNEGQAARSSAAGAPLLRAFVLFHEAELLGAGTSVLNAAAPLGQYGWSLTGWVPGAGALEDAAVSHLASVSGAPRPLAVSVRRWREQPGIRARLRASPEYVSEVRAALLRARPHVVHANTLLSLPEACIARSLGLPIVLHVHELPPPTLKRAAALRLATVADVLVGVSDAVTAMLRRHVRTRPVLTARNGVVLAERDRAAGERPFTVGTIGTVSRLKGTDVFFRAAALAAEQRPGLRFEHAGQHNQHRDAGLDEELARLAAAPPLDRAAVQLGRRAAADVLPRWDLFVLPSRMDAFPLATLEAMAAGVPVIASQVGGVPEQIGHLEHGVLVPPGEEAALAEWIVRLHDDHGLRARLATAARRRVATDFTVERQAERLHHAYLLALNRRFGPPAVRAAALAG